MLKEIQIGGELRPVRFGFNALAEFCKLTGLTIGTLDQINSLDFGHVRALVFCGLKDGARKEKKPFPFTLEDIGDWMDDNKEALVEVFEEFVNSQAPASAEGSTSGEG